MIKAVPVLGRLFPMHLLDKCFDIFLRDKADRFVDFLAVLEDYEGRDAHDAELCGELLLLIDVDLADFHFTVGPHPGAQKSMSTVPLASRTSAWKFSLVMVIASMRYLLGK